MTGHPTERLQHALDDGRFDGSGPEPDELKYFLDTLLADAPDDFEPWLFRCRKESKAPATKFGSWKDESNRLTPEEAVEAMRSGWNIGIAGTPDDRLVNVDIDDDDATDVEAIQQSVRSRSRSRTGRHTQYFAVEGEDIPNIPTDDAGEIRARWQYVLAPGSYVPTNPEEEGLDIPDAQLPLVGYYTVEKPHEPTEIEYDDLPEVFREAYEAAQEAESETPDPDAPDAGEIDTDDEGTSALFDIQVRGVIRREGGTTDPHARWSAIFHGSSTDANMSVSDKGRLHCWRHGVAHGGLQVLAVLSSETESGESACLHVGTGHKNSGAGPSRRSGGELVWPAWEYAKRSGYLPDDDPIPHSALAYLANERGLCDADEIEDGWKLPREAFNEALEVVAAEFGLEPGRDPIDEPEPDLNDDEITSYAHVIDRRRAFETIDDIDLPQHHSYVLDKPPRAGGSYAILQDFTDSDMPFMVLAPRHSILEYHVETVSDLIDPDYSILHLKGKARVCESGAGNCELIPRDRQEYQDAMTDVRNAVHRNHIVTPSDAPTGLCKHWFMTAAAEFVDVVLTVPQIARRIDRDFADMKLFIDEEQTLDNFHPGAIDLLTVGTTTETDGSTTVQLRGAPILGELETLREILDRIEQDQQERKENPETEGWRETTVEADVKDAVEAVDKIANALGLSKAKRAVIDDGESPTLKLTIDELRERVAGIEFPEPDTDPDELVEAISEYCRGYYWDDSVDPGATLTAVLFPYEDKPFHFKTAAGEVTCRLIGDKEQIFHADWFGEFEQVAAIAGPGGERFMQEVRPDPVAVDLETFPYADQFVVVPIGKRDSDGDMEPVGESRDRVERTVHELNARSHPCIAVTGTKDRAGQLDNSLRKTTSNVVAEPDNPAVELYKLWTNGNTAIIYENSIVSRGIDAPYFDVTAIVSPGFAVPYWEARKEYYRDHDSEKYMEAAAVEQELKDRELTNAALRMSHTYDTADKLGTKFILCAHGDADRLKFVSERITPKVTYADQAAELLSLLTAGGPFQTTLGSVEDGLGGSQKDFTTTALDEQFTESHVARPGYDLSEVSEWVESAYLNQEAVQSVINAVKRVGDGAKTEDIYTKCPSLSRGRAKAILNILERKGKVFSAKGESTGGAPPTVWEISDPLL